MRVRRSEWAIPWSWVFGAATVLGVFSTLQAYRLATVAAKPGYRVEVGPLFILNLALWYVPALLVPAIVRTSQRFPLATAPRSAALAVHSAAALAFSVLHIVTILALRWLLWGNGIKPPQISWSSYVQRQYLTELDWCLVTYAVIVGIAHAIAYHHESQARKVTEARLETQLVEARLRTLEAELNPHFLFNTLHAISALLHRDADAADRIISRLSDLLRLTLDRGTGPIVPLKDELECLQKYLDIAQIRFGDRLSVAMQIDPEALDGEVPRMILQPLVENAVKHGISQQSQTGQLAISAAAVGGRLRIEIADDGGGLRAKTPQDGRGGVGLSNTRARLECLYGADHRLDLVDCGSGLTVRVEIPFRRAAATAAAAATFRVA